VSFTLKFTSFVDLDLSVLTFREVSGDNKLSLIPFVSTDIHFESFDVLTSVDEVFLSEVELAYFSVMLSNLSVVGSSNLWGLVLN
jgi:hypothetical protein